jgi:hypothetical protein
VGRVTDNNAHFTNMSTFAFDTETYYDKDYSVKSLGPVAYALDPRFDCYMVSIAGDDGFEWVGHPKDAPWDRLHNHTWVSHNAAFDAAVFLRMLKDDIVPDGTFPSEWHCTADLCAYLQFPRSLADSCRALFGVALNKDVRTKQQGKHHQAELTLDTELVDYALDDARYCLRLWQEYGDRWPEHERRLSHLTRFWGMAGVHVDAAMIDRDIAALMKMRWEAEQALPWTSDGDAVVLSVKHLAEACRGAGIEPPPSLAMDNEECDEWLEKYGAEYPWVGAMRQWRRTNMLLTKYEAIKRRVRGEQMPYNLKYCGAAHTGRWSGDAGVNMQNLPRGEMFGCTLRHVFVPSPGRKFIVADFSQIEMRVLAWLADDTRLIQAIAEHPDFYEAMARVMGLWSGDQPLKSDPALRHKVKGIGLGLGYGMGPVKFAKVAQIEPEEARRLVNLYKDTNKPVVRMWRELERMARKAATGNQRELSLALPSGRTIRYFDVKMDRGITAALTLGGRRAFLTGPHLTENMTQATARELMAAALLRVDEIDDCRVVWHVHDEIIAEVPEALVKQKQQEIEAAMCAIPDWAAGLPVAVESSIEERYTK